MKKQDKLTLLFTFVVGFCFGVFLFFTGFSPAFNSSTVPAVDDTVVLSIIGEAYGGCRTDCPSFIVNSDGTFRYLYTPQIGEMQIIRSGTLPFSLRTELGRYVTPASLMVQSEMLEPSFCNSYVDGIDVKYTITRSSVTYTLDTCGTMVETESALWQSLVKIWNHFETIE